YSRFSFSIVRITSQAFPAEANSDQAGADPAPVSVKYVTDLPELGERIEGQIDELLLPAVVGHGSADAERQLIAGDKVLQALGLQVLLRLDLQRDHIPAVLEDEVHLSGGILRRPVVGRSAQIGNELLADILLCERSLKLGEDGVALEQRLGIQIRHSRQ